jgi:hypothetical protein
MSRLSTHYLCKSSEGLDNGFELEVIEEEKKVSNGESDKAKGKEVEAQVDELGGLQYKGEQREQSEDCLFKFIGLIY